VRQERLGQFKKPNNIENRTRDLPACSRNTLICFKALTRHLPQTTEEVCELPFCTDDHEPRIGTPGSLVYDAGMLTAGSQCSVQRLLHVPNHTFQNIFEINVTG
jgi:hypothetical protein